LPNANISHYEAAGQDKKCPTEPSTGRNQRLSGFVGQCINL